jgi:hypothetical protein
VNNHFVWSWANVIEKGGIVVDDLTPAHRAMATDTMLAIMFLGGADPNRYRQRLENLEILYLEGQKNYPGTLADAYKLLSNWPKQSPRDSSGSNDGVAFVTDDEDAHGVSLTTQDQSLLVAISRTSPATHAASRVTMLRSARIARLRLPNPIKAESNCCRMVLTSWNSRTTGFNSCKSLS